MTFMPKKTKPSKRVWRVVCVLGNRRVSGSCGHAHRTPTHALRCAYEPREYLFDRDAVLLVRPQVQRAA